MQASWKVDLHGNDGTVVTGAGAALTLFLQYFFLGDAAEPPFRFFLHRRFSPPAPLFGLQRKYCSFSTSAPPAFFLSLSHTISIHNFPVSSVRRGATVGRSCGLSAAGSSSKSCALAEDRACLLPASLTGVMAAASLFLSNTFRDSTAHSDRLEGTVLSCK